jgi:hypothetical protein
MIAGYYFKVVGEMKIVPLTALISALILLLLQIGI